MKKRLLPAVAVLILFLGGCGFKDIDNRFFVVTMGIDRPEDDGDLIKVSLKLAIPTADTRSDDSRFVVVTETSETISEAIRIIKSRVDKELDFGHLKVILLGDSLTGESVKREMDWFYRRRDIQKIAWIAIGKPTAEEVMKIKPPSERLASNTLFLSFDLQGSESPYTISKYLFQFYRESKSKGISPVLPVVKVKNGLLEINQADIFKDHKRALRLSKNETKTFNALKHEFEKQQITVKEQDKFFVVSIDNYKSDIKIAENSKGAAVEVGISVQGTIEESRSDLSKKELEVYNQLLEKEIERIVKDLLKKFQYNSLDPMGFGLAYRASHFEKEEWERWNAIYPDIDIKVKADSKIMGTGIIE
ncbi:Ger(x)C family spore germination protein [Bacillus infantis]|uniref:Ger(x)C family spore germination protein n=1 Tax=Bacillus infantis TaxID=324767 RepID=UPI001CD41780|nr:Ger(x)C family spore germination protein [Bacillus infantis]MCA1039609.1 Ger(x)C family spore germination protein [Bacillus infantis]